MNFLIVDDHSGYRALIRKLIAKPGDRVRECASGEAALEALETFVPDWITVDLMLPGMNGFATIRALRRVNTTARVVMISSYDDPECHAVALALGAEAFVAKAHLVRLQDLIKGGEAAVSA